jgi:hypothetical protein
LADPESAVRPASPGHRPEVLEALGDLFAGRPDVTPGKMFGFPAFYTEGRLFACVYGSGVGFKLPEATVQDLLARPGFTQFVPYGKAVMREWIHLERPNPTDYAADLDLLQQSIEFVAQSPKPKRRSRR